MQESLKDFSTQQLQKYYLPVTQKNLKKLRRKFTDVLKNDDPFYQENVWNRAKTQIIGRNKVKLFSSKDLAILEQKIRPYMQKQVIKNASMPSDQMKKEMKEKHAFLAQIEANDPQQQKNLIKELSNPNSSVWKFTPETQSPKDTSYRQTEETLKSEINQIMLEALFNKFFTPAPNWKKRFVQDYNLVNSPNADQNIDSPLYIDALYRLNNPKGKKSYYTDRN